VKTYRLSGPWAAAAAIALMLTSAAAPPARADIELINNGGFEAGFASWIHQDFLASEGTFFLQTGTTSPVNGDPVPAPPGGTTAAMTDAQGPGSHVLYQDFVVPAGVNSATLQFSLFIGNRATNPTAPTQPLFASPATLDWTTPALNQQARVDILRSGTDPFSVAPADVLQNAFQTNPGNTFGPGYATFTADVTSLLAARGGQTLRLRFAEADNVFTFQLGVDDVSLRFSAVPEPSSMVLCGMGTLLGLAAYGRRRPLQTAQESG
jgi:hypothetical protein